MFFSGLQPQLQQALAQAEWSEARLKCLNRLLQASDFARVVLEQQPALLAELDAPLTPLHLAEGEEGQWPATLRRWRKAQSVKLIWRDVCGIDSVEQTLQGSTWIAEQALSVAFSRLLQAMQAVHGVVRAEDGAEQHMVVIALGKLGGGELNFSSDVDLVYAFTGHGMSDGVRPLAAEAYFTRLGQRLANLLDDVSADGFCHRVDLRLRPFGASGRLLLSFNAMEQYFQSAGRDWERYAWLKARPVAGDLDSGWQLLRLLRPFVFRRYLDFTAIDGLRDMKAKIVAEVNRRDKVDDLKLGRGGIREIEFLVQALQIIYGGRNAALQLRGLLPALAQLRREGLVSAPAAERLREAYLFLRRLENRVQMLADAQVHQLPQQPDVLERLAHSLEYSDAAELRRSLDRHRWAVEQQFDGLLGSEDVGGRKDAGIEGLSASAIRAQGYAEPEKHAERLQALMRSNAAAALSDRSKQRFLQVAVLFVEQCATAVNPDACLMHATAFLQATVKRSSYIALLVEQPSSLKRVVGVFDSSLWMAQQLINHPLLLDELLDARFIEQPNDDGSLSAQLSTMLAAHAGDVEAQLLELNEFKISQSFKIAYHVIFQSLSAVNASRWLTRLAETVLDHCNRLARQELERQHGNIEGAEFAVIGYGSLSARALAFNSDLDLVFLNRNADCDSSNGERPLEAARFFQRQAQKIIALLNLSTPSGSLYEADIRLRPDGAKGLMVSSLDSFSRYQQERAWVWETQALVRARAIAGDPNLCADFEALRRGLICKTRDNAELFAEVIAMRRRMRGELDRSSEGHFDLKHGHGGLTDIEFFLQAMVLGHAARHPALADARETPETLAVLAAEGLISAEVEQCLQQAVEFLQRQGLLCHLACQSRVLPCNAEITAITESVTAALQGAGFDFSRH